MKNNLMNKGVWVSSKILSERIDGEFYKSEDINLLEILSSSGLNLKSLTQISEKIKDGPHDGYKFVENGVLFIRSQNIKDCGYDFTDIKYIEQEFHSKFRSSWLEKGDLLITRIGEYYGMSAVVTDTYKDCNINHAIAKIKLKKQYDPYYVCAYTSSNIGNRLYRRLGKSFTSPRVNLSDYSEFIIPIPSPKIQKYIGDKVRKAEELREEAKELKEQGYFLIEELLNIKTDLEKLNDDNRKHKWLKIEALNDRIDSEYYKEKYLETINHLKGLSYKYIPLKKMVLDMYTGKKPRQIESGKEVYFIQSGNISGNFLEVGDKVTVKVENYNVIERGDLLIAKDGNTIGKMAVNFSSELAIINEHTYCIRFNEEYKKYSAYVYYLLVNDNINELLKREATGSAQKGLNQQFIDNMIIPLINEESVEKLYEIEEKRCNNIYLSKQLIQEAKKDVEDLIEGNFDMSKGMPDDIE